MDSVSVHFKMQNILRLDDFAGALETSEKASLFCFRRHQIKSFLAHSVLLHLSVFVKVKSHFLL